MFVLWKCSHFRNVSSVLFLAVGCYTPVCVFHFKWKMIFLKSLLDPIYITFSSSIMLGGGGITCNCFMPNWYHTEISHSGLLSSDKTQPNPPKELKFHVSSTRPNLNPVYFTVSDTTLSKSHQKSIHRNWYFKQFCQNPKKSPDANRVC